MDAIPVTILTGFLGSGKTTILSRLLRDPSVTDTAVIINEFGEISLDHHLVERSDEDIVELRGGCLCCTIRGDLAVTLKSLFKQRERGQVGHFRRVVIETTGLADPAPILHLLMTDPQVGRFYRLDGVATAVDAVNGSGTLDAHFEAVKQVAVADRILLTKTDLVGPGDEADLDRLRQRIREANPAAPAVDSVDGRVDPAFLFGAGLYDPLTKTLDVQRWLRDEALDHGHAHHQHDRNRHGPDIRAFCVRRDGAVPVGAVEEFLALLLEQRGADLLRLKAIVNVAEEDGPLVLHAVQHVLHPPAYLPAWPDQDRSTRIVCITRGDAESWIAGLWDRLSP